MIQFFGTLLALWCVGYFLTAIYKRWKFKRQVRIHKAKVAKYFEEEKAKKKDVKYNVHFMTDYKRKVKKFY